MGEPAGITGHSHLRLYLRLPEPRGFMNACDAAACGHAPDRTGPGNERPAATAEPEARGGGAFFKQNPRSAHFVTQTP